MNGFNEIQEGQIRDSLKPFDLKLEDLTCFTCSHQFVCKCAYDSYNTNGDCLMEK